MHLASKTPKTVIMIVPSKNISELGALKHKISRYKLIMLVLEYVNFLYETCVLLC